MRVALQPLERQLTALGVGGVAAGSGEAIEFEVRCLAPPRHPASAGTASFSLALNAHDYLRPLDGSDFLYYDDPHVYGIIPTGGPMRGGTEVTVLGHGFRGLDGDISVARCQFGELTSWGRVVHIDEV